MSPCRWTKFWVCVEIPVTWKGTRFWSLAGGDWCNLVRLEAVRFCHREDRLRVDNSGVVNFFFFFYGFFKIWKQRVLLQYGEILQDSLKAWVYQSLLQSTVACESDGVSLLAEMRCPAFCFQLISKRHSPSLSPKPLTFSLCAAAVGVTVFWGIFSCLPFNDQICFGMLCVTR